MIDFMSLLFALGLGFGLSCWIFGTILDKSNNIGDSRGDKNQYGAYIVYTDKKDRLSKDDRQSYVYRNAIKIDEPGSAPAGSEKVRRLTEEELEQYDHNAQATTLNGYTQAVNPAQAGGLYQNKADLSDVEDEFAAWERQQANNDMSGVFKPLDNK